MAPGNPNRMRRIQKELQDIQSDKTSGVDARAVYEGDITKLQASFVGPADTPYEGGTFFVDVNIPSDYPFQPPIMKFITRLWHPNISSQTGAICLDTLGTAWSPVLTIKAALISLQSLLSSPEPKDPQDAEVASMMIKHPDQFQDKAREWAIQYAGAPHTTNWYTSREHVERPDTPDPRQKSEEEQEIQYAGYNRALIDRFVNMGFDIDKVVNAFMAVGIDKNEGRDYELEEAYMGDITATLLGEP